MELQSCTYRAARGLIGMPQKGVAEAAGVDRRSVMCAEALECGKLPREVYRLRLYYERVGVIFLQDGVGVPCQGVRLLFASNSWNFRTQFRAARYLVGWTQDELATRTGINRLAITRHENSTSKHTRYDYLTKMQSCFKNAGVRLIDEDEFGVGVQWDVAHAASQIVSKCLAKVSG